MDFTLKTYKSLLQSIKNSGYTFQTFEDFIRNPKEKVVVLRHDVDLLPQNSQSFALIQAEMSVKATYYFRAVPESWDEGIIKEIANLGHEVGYHYENMDVTYSKLKDKRLKAKVERGSIEYDRLIDLAYEDFCESLEKLRKLVAVSTICMHGSPKSPFDNKAIWDKYDYRELGIIGEPYFDVNFNEVLYLTDTGRRWDGWKVSVRDKMPQQDSWVKKGWIFHSTNDIINAIKEDRLQKKIMITFHPQRWNDRLLPWLKEYFFQKTKNIAKYFLIQYRTWKSEHSVF